MVEAFSENDSTTKILTQPIVEQEERLLRQKLKWLAPIYMRMGNVGFAAETELSYSHFLVSTLPNEKSLELGSNLPGIVFAPSEADCKHMSI